MKTKLQILTLVTTLYIGLTRTATAADDHQHLATPKGGRLLEKTTPHAEFVIEKDRTATINFYTHDLKPVAVAGQSATVIADTKEGKSKIEFEKKGDSLISKSPLPQGNDYNLIVQFKQSADAKPQNFRFKPDLNTCGECKRAEYACICGH